MGVDVLCDGDCCIGDGKILLSHVQIVLSYEHAKEFNDWLELYAKVTREPADPAHVIRLALEYYLEVNKDD